MNIIEQNKEKINGKFETFDRLIVNGYILQLNNFRQFLFYLIQNGIRLVDFDKFALGQTNSLCSHIESYIKDNRIKFKINKNQVKMYDKGNNLRIEVTINNPKDSLYTDSCLLF